MADQDINVTIAESNVIEVSVAGESTQLEIAVNDNI